MALIFDWKMDVKSLRLWGLCPSESSFSTKQRSDSRFPVMTLVVAGRSEFSPRFRMSYKKGLVGYFTILWGCFECRGLLFQAGLCFVQKKIIIDRLVSGRNKEPNFWIHLKLLMIDVNVWQLVYALMFIPVKLPGWKWIVLAGGPFRTLIQK